MRPHLPRVEPGDPITAAAYNRLVDAVNAVLSMTAGNGLNLSHSPGGMHLSLSRSEKLWLFEITSSTPSTTASGDRYWAADRMRLGSGTTWGADIPSGYSLFDPLDNPRSRHHLDGERVVARFNDESARWEIVYGHANLRVGKINQVGGIAKGANGTVDLYSGNALAEADTGIDITANNRHNATCANGKWVILAHVEGSGWYILDEEV